MSLLLLEAGGVSVTPPHIASTLLYAPTFEGEFDQEQAVPHQVTTTILFSPTVVGWLRESSQALEVAVYGDPNIRLSQDSLEVIVYGDPNVRPSSFALEVAVQLPYPPVPRQATRVWRRR